ncbi:hypothetical protein [Paraburkholderia sp. A3RO-2L]|uniref:hypothetical protein n=1 Tax=unclassified Paraburkholderia TaxID=2615204 RepID=UPI003DA947A0
MSNSHWIDTLVTRLPHVRPSFVEEVKNMSREELQRRVLIGSDWQGAFACSLDGIPEISCMPGGGIDGCRSNREVRAIVTQLVKECPRTWAKTWTGQMKTDAPVADAAATSEQLNQEAKHED